MSPMSIVQKTSPPASSIRPRLLVRYKDEIVPRLKADLGLRNAMAVPRLHKITLNTGVGDAITDKKALDEAVRDLGRIAGQRPVVTKARVSVSGFKLRQGMPIGCKVTLRGPRMYEFLDRLVSLAIPRVRDFRGLNPRSFDGHGNYSLGVAEKTIFPEIDIDKVEYLKQGLDVTITISGGSDERSRALLKAFGMPFRQ